MTKKLNCIARFLSGQKGQRFFNFAYSIGAAIVIWGALFKILHLPGGSTLLCIGMGTEVLMFVLSAFESPESFREAPEDVSASASAYAEAPVGAPKRAVAAPPSAAADTRAIAGCAEAFSDAGEQMLRMREATEALGKVSETLLKSFSAIAGHGDEIERDAKGYVEQMQALNRNLSGLNTIYEIQLKSISSQLDSIERVNRGLKDVRDMYEKSARESAAYCEQTEKMAANIRRLNAVYENMLTAMTVNMGIGVAPGAVPGNPFSREQAPAPHPDNK